MKEIRYGNSKAPFHEIAEKDGFMGTFVRAVFSFGTTPLDYGTALQHSHILQLLHISFRHLAFLPGKIGNLFNLRLGLGFLGGHLGVMSRLLRTTLGGCKRAQGNREHVRESLGSLDLQSAAARSEKSKKP